MPELHGFVTGLATFYAAALTGLAVAHAARGNAGRSPGARPTASPPPAFIPAVAVLVVPLAAACHPAHVGLFSAGHELWHQAQQRLHCIAEIHGALHVANLALLGLFLALSIRTVYRLARQHAFSRALFAVATRLTEQEGPVYQLPSAWSGCFTLGVFRPRVLITSALLAQLGPRELEVVLAHEEAHLRRRDRLVETLLHCFFGLLPLPGTRKLLRDWRRSAEQACDAYAAVKVGSPHDVAATILRVAQLSQPSAASLPGASSFVEAQDDLEGRIAALLAPPDPPLRVLPPALQVAGSLSAMLLAGFWVRHLVELFVHH